ncbi:MAG: NADH-quinone oxidoreductase subunit L [Acidimicrobiaceae bacterium]|jgi:NADH-quinone oxidoreductase subunit L|nr:NADH-quinone oxidoreductase subunit L [Acidimicrobiaceae bacterium]MBT5579373.1 NADH-quinone oxidoreductase subunit L [Acidimicrobiaceae bacterium]MBT5849770.1 NADH-quinone oxidoreductase subunit L [Acidimicrobiaceae bacterium]
MLDAAFLIPAFPLLGFVAILFFGRKLGEPGAGWLATLAMGGSFASAVVVFFGLVNEPAEERRFVQTLWEWVPAGDFSVDVGFLVDPLSVTMTLFITGVGALIHLYSIAYMHGDKNFSKFFLYLNLFAFSMLMLVLGDNMLITFLGWEGVGACSYFLISFWFTDEANASAGKKAFVTNRIGDWGFMVAMFLTFTTIGSIQYVDLLGNASTLTQNTATAITVLLFVGAAGKSAQIPLYVWLPDAMAGPTPVSALIHAATMVTSGVYLLTRVNPVIAESAAWAPSMIAWVGAGTALFAATVAVAQNDIKKVLAYSTVSQLGYMFLAVGTGAYVAAIFHMVTHAFFKALLFLGSGSVIHGMDNDQDMRHYGGLQKLMPITSITFIIGWLAIAGVPPFAGFWSKDEILAYAYEENVALWAIGLLTAILTAFYMSRQVFMTFFGRYRFADVRSEEIAEIWQGRIALAEAALVDAESEIGSAEDGITKAEEKLAKAQEKLEQRQTEMAEVDQADEKAADKATKNLEKANDGVVKAQMSVDEVVVSVDEARTSVMQARLDVESIVNAAAAGGDDLDGVSEDDLPPAVRARREYHPHESPWQMTFPLVVLAGAAVVAGVMNLPFSSDLHFLGDWLKPSTFGNEAHLSSGGGTLWVLAIIAVAGGIAGIAAAVAVYLKGRYPAEKIELPILEQAWRFDQTISDFMGGPGRKGFERVAWFDARFIDGAVNGAGRLVREGGGQLRRLQTGLVRSYAALVAVGAVGLLAWFLTRTTI